jgi:putative FmdB family regulatory protein
MPIYEYKCDECGHRLESIQKLNDAPLKECPACSRASLRRLISATGFQLKGSGWYATDFKNKGRKDSKQDQSKQDQSKKDQAEKPSSESGDITPTKKAHSGGGGACGCA